MRPRCGQTWWSTAGSKIPAKVFCLVELSGLEPLTPCLQKTLGWFGMVRGVAFLDPRDRHGPAWFGMVATGLSYSSRCGSTANI